MKKMLIAGAVLAAFGGAAQAAVTYAWEATCVSRYVGSYYGEPRIELGCPQKKIRGLLDMGPDYVPGSSYYINDHEPGQGPAPLMTLYDPHPDLMMNAYPVDSTSFDFSFWAQLPEKSGPGTIRWMAFERGFYEDYYVVEASPNPLGIEWTDLTFRLLPEPSSLALFGAGLLGLIGLRRRT